MGQVIDYDRESEFFYVQTISSLGILKSSNYSAFIYDFRIIDEITYLLSFFGPSFFLWLTTKKSKFYSLSFLL